MPKPSDQPGSVLKRGLQHITGSQKTIKVPTHWRKRVTEVQLDVSTITSNSLRTQTTQTLYTQFPQRPELLREVYLQLARYIDNMRRLLDVVQVVSWPACMTIRVIPRDSLRDFRPLNASYIARDFSASGQ